DIRVHRCALVAKLHLVLDIKAAQQRGISASCHRSRQAESRHLAALKERDCADPTTSQGDHDEFDAVSRATQGPEEIDAECGLSVAPRREEPVAPTIAERNCRKPALDLLLAAVLTRSRWHAHPRVLSQESHQRVGIAFLPGTN